MTLLGHVCNGKIELDDPVSLPEGAKVRIELDPAPAEEAGQADQPETLGQKLMKYAGLIQDAPPDLARQHDHYLHGTPKK